MSERKKNGSIMRLEHDDEGIVFFRSLSSSVSNACERFFQSRGIEKRGAFFNPKVKKGAK